MPRASRWTDFVPLVVFIGVAIGVHVAPMNAVDLAITHAVQRLTVADGLFRAISWCGTHPVDVIAPCAAIAIMIVVGWRRDAAFTAISVLGSWLLDHGVGAWIARPRPDAALLHERMSHSSSFPSGHVMQYVALYGFVAIVVRARWSRPGMRQLATCALVGLVGLVALVGPSRVYLGAHWASDVVGAYLLGGWWLLVVRRAYLTRTIGAPRP